jgi:hypothetical protein
MGLKCNECGADVSREAIECPCCDKYDPTGRLGVEFSKFKEQINAERAEFVKRVTGKNTSDN